MKLYVNGVDATTGNYLLPPMDHVAAGRIIRGEKADSATMTWLKAVWNRISQAHFGLPMDIDPKDIRQAGWGIMISTNEDPSVLEALAPLIEHRRNQIRDDSKVKILDYRSQENRDQWLARHGVSTGNVRPSKVPYYLLIIGNPATIPFEIRHHLGVEYATGSLNFDTANEYYQYATSVVANESKPPLHGIRNALFFGVRHAFDNATQLSADYLVKPLAETIEKNGIASSHGFEIHRLLAEQATKAALLDVLSSHNVNVRPPSLLFTASHGIGFPTGHPMQVSSQGALLCQEWPGLGFVNPAHYFAAADLPANANVQGMITFHFACYSAGTPFRDRFLHQPGSTPPQIAQQPFIASLPKRFLAHPRGSALACIGHIERAWGCSITRPGAGIQILPFENAIGRILSGIPVGYAMKDFGELYASSSVSLSAMLEEISYGTNISDEALATAWVARNDSEGYLILGDPAVHL